MWTINDRFICDHCGKFAKLYDSYTPFGCSSYDPPEPLDPTQICKKCSDYLKQEWIKKFKEKNWKYGHWQKSLAEQEAAKECGLVWLHSSGVGIYGTSNYKNPYQYISQEEYDKLSIVTGE